MRWEKKKKKAVSMISSLICPPESCLVKKTEVGENTIAAHLRKKRERERTHICFLLFVDLSWTYSCEKKVRRRSGFIALNYHIRLSKRKGGKQQQQQEKQYQQQWQPQQPSNGKLLLFCFPSVRPFLPFFFFMYVLYRVTGRGSFGYLCGCLPFST